jgi:hypothetical protein
MAKCIDFGTPGAMQCARYAHDAGDARRVIAGAAMWATREHK